MNIKEAIKSILKNEHVTQTQLAMKMGFRNQSGVSELLRKKNSNISSVLKLCEAMDYELVLRPKKGTDKVERTIIVDSAGD